MHRLQRQLALLLQRPLRKERLRLGHDRRADQAARLAHRVRLVAHARHQRKVLGNVVRDDARDAQLGRRRRPQVVLAARAARAAGAPRC